MSDSGKAVINNLVAKLHNATVGKMEAKKASNEEKSTGKNKNLDIMDTMSGMYAQITGVQSIIYTMFNIMTFYYRLGSWVVLIGILLQYIRSATFHDKGEDFIGWIMSVRWISTPLCLFLWPIKPCFYAWPGQYVALFDIGLEAAVQQMMQAG